MLIGRLSKGVLLLRGPLLILRMLCKLGTSLCLILRHCWLLVELRRANVLSIYIAPSRLDHWWRTLLLLASVASRRTR